MVSHIDEDNATEMQKPRRKREKKRKKRKKRKRGKRISKKKWAPEEKTGRKRMRQRKK